ncbi:ABC transporter substrate-binding protein [Actinomadura sp. KC216]|uniref:ABC transporter substrate-binding protein n=1 Tax=Actinomadura sp. KC216 TaxID=2530370 RepID=UPI001404821C|nr:ABC transporter substrate-binding protein [Actinomadura sp. KC216]
MRDKVNRRTASMWCSGVCVAFLALAGCGGQAASGGAGGKVDDLSIRLESDWDSLDPARAQGTYAFQVIGSLYDRLVAIENGKVVPYLATSWKQAPDSVTFTLRPGVTCGDGQALTPAAVAESLKRLGDPKTKAPYAQLVFGSAGHTVTSDATANQVTVRTAKPYSDLLEGLAQPMASIVCPAGLKAPDSLGATPAGSGPYTLTKSVRGSQYTLTARSGYGWGPQTGKAHYYPRKVTFRVVANQSTAANLLTTGQLGIGAISGADTRRLQSNTSVKRTSQLTNGSYFLVFNQAPGRPGADPAVRRALARAVSASSFNKAAMHGSSTEARSVFSPMMPCYRAVLPGPMAADVNAARQALTAAGWSGGSGTLSKAGKPLRLKLAGTNEMGPGFEYLQVALRSAGADVTLRNGDTKTLAETLFGTGDWDATVYPFTPPAPTPSALSLFVTGPAAPNGTNFAAMDDPSYDAAAAKALSALGPQRCEAWGEAQQALHDSANVFPLVHLKTDWFSSVPVRFGLADGATTVDIHTITTTAGS